MSELIAEARVLVTPDTTSFRSLLTAQVTAAAKGVTVPVVVTPVAAGTGGIAAIGEAATVASRELAVADRISKQFQVTTLGIATSATAATEALGNEAAAAQTVAVGLTRSSVSSAQIARVNEQMAVTAAAFAKAQESTITPLVASRRAAVALAEAEKLMEVASQGAAVAQERLSKSLVTSVAGFHESAVAANEAAIAQKRLAASAAETSATQGGLAKGAGSAAASLLGVRGATLAATGPFIAGAAGAIAFGKALSIATGFTSQLSVFAATTGATADEMERVSAAARQLGKDITLPGVSASDAAEAMTEFAKAGLSVNDAIAATRGGLQLATAAQLSNADAVTLTANALNTFKLNGDQAVDVADTLANAANAAQGSIEDIGLGLRQAASAAAAVGVSFEDTTALLTLLAKNGLTASDAGTSLRTAFIRLVNPSKQAQKILSDLNVQLRDANGNVRPEIFAEFADAQRNLSRATQDANTAIVFGQDAFRAQAVLGREGVQSLNDTRKALEQTGTAARVAGARMVGLAGATANLKNQLESLGLSVGDLATGPLKLLVDNLAGVVGGFNDGIVAAKGFAAALSDIGGGEQQDPFKQVKQIGSFLVGTNIFNIKSQIEKLVEEPKKDMLTAGAEIASSIEDAGRIAARGAVPFGEQITGALDAAFALVQRSIQEGQQKIRSAQLGATAKGAGQQAGLEEAFSGILASGGSVQQQIANLRRQAEVQSKIIDEAGPNAAGVLLQRRRSAREKLGSINQQIISLEKGIAADQQAARDALQRIRDQAKSDADRAFLQAQEDARSRQDRLITVAGDTPALADDIRRQQQLRTLIKKQIVALQASTVDEDAKKSAIRALRQAVAATTDELKRLQASQRAQRAQQRADAQEQATENLALRTQIAEARGAATSVVVKRIDAQIADARKTQARAKRGSNEWLKATLALEELRQKRRELLKTAADTAKDTAGFGSFEFMQRQQGFAANLLGNLIPGFATAGLVGNTVAAAQPRITDPAASFEEKVPFGNQLDRGVRPVQVDTTNALLRQILGALGGRHTQPPEIAFNRRWGAAGFDTM